LATYSELNIQQGTDFSADITLVDDLNQPIVLDTYSIVSQMRKSYYALTAYDFTTSIIESANGILRIAMTSEYTSNIKPGRYVFDILIYDATTTTRVIEGIINVNPSVTKL
jgi:hypothetical protein